MYRRAYPKASLFMYFIFIIQLIGIGIIFPHNGWASTSMAESYDYQRIDLAENGLVAYYPFNGNANDESGNGNHGTLEGPTLTEDRFGNPDSAYSFDGYDDYIKVADNDSLDITNAITMASWIYIESYTSTWGAPIFCKGNRNAPYSLTIHSNGEIYSRFTGDEHFFGNTIPIKQWIHVAVTWDGTSVKFYADAVPHSEIHSYSGLLDAITGDMFIGIDPQGITEKHYGKLDELYLYNRALSESEIQSLYQKGGGIIKNFTANKTSGNAPLTVEFTDTTPGNPTSWQWDFNNDGIIDSTLQNPVYSYHSSGIYSVKMIVTIEGVEHEVLKTGYIIVDKPVNPLPELQVTQLDSSQAISGQTVEVSWIITNSGQGNTSVPVWYDRVWISPDIDVRPGNEEDILLGEFQNLSYLGAGESYIQTRRFTIPDGIMGTYYLFVVTDNYDAYNVDEATMEASTHVNSKVNLVPETNDDNNFNFIEINVTPPPPSDLSVASMSAPSETFSGNQINVAWSVENTGENNTNAESWWDAVYFTRNEELNVADATLLGKYNHAGTLENTGMLAPGQSYQMDADVLIPQGVYGDYFIFVVTDNNNDVYESAFESNNFGKQAVSVTLTPPPDLEIIDFTVPGIIDSGQSVNIQWTVENKGPGELPDGYWRDGIYLHTDSIFDPETAISIGSFSRSGSLSVNSTYSKDVNVTVPNGLEGTYYVFIKTDNDNMVFEHTYEDNNISSAGTIQINLSPWADLQISDLQIPASVTAGQRVNISFSVDNNGEAAAGSHLIEVYISGDAQFSKEDDTLLASISHTDPLPSAESYSQNADFTIPYDLSGTYYIFVVPIVA